METKKLYLSRTDKKLAGVCGGIGKFFTMDPTIWRLIFFMGGLFACPFFLLTYIVMWVVIPKEVLGIE